MSVKISLQQEASTEIPASLLNSFFKNLTRVDNGHFPVYQYRVACPSEEVQFILLVTRVSKATNTTTS